MSKTNRRIDALEARIVALEANRYRMEELMRLHQSQGKTVEFAQDLIRERNEARLKLSTIAAALGVHPSSDLAEYAHRFVQRVRAYERTAEPATEPEAQA